MLCIVIVRFGHKYGLNKCYHSNPLWVINYNNITNCFSCRKEKNIIREIITLFGGAVENRDVFRSGLQRNSIVLCKVRAT